MYNIYIYIITKIFNKIFFSSKGAGYIIHDRGLHDSCNTPEEVVLQCTSMGHGKWPHWHGLYALDIVSVLLRPYMWQRECPRLPNIVNVMQLWFTIHYSDSTGFQLDCLFNILLRLISKSKLCIIGPLRGESTNHWWILFTRSQYSGKYSAKCSILWCYHVVAYAYTWVEPVLNRCWNHS